jgi:glutathione S-transferase
MIELYQFTFSHYCEKARWALDYKGIPYTPCNLLPGLHIKPAKKLATKSDLPIIVDGGAVVQDSTEIINYLDRKFRGCALTPGDPAQAKEALDWEEYLDEEIGVSLMLWFYFHHLRDRKRALNYFVQGGPWYGRPLFSIIFPRVRDRMMKFMKIDADTGRRSEERLLRAFDRLDDSLRNRRFLVGDQFSRADLTACALLLIHHLRPGESDARVSNVFAAPVRQLRESHKSRRYFVWANEIYREYRRPPLRGGYRVAA